MYRTNHIQSAFVLLLMLFLIACSPDVPTVTPSQASDLLARKKAVMIDVREQAEWDEQHIDGAIFIPLSQVEKRISELTQYKNSPIIMQCRSGKRSNVAAGKLINAGFNKVYNLDGGILAWDKQGLDIIRGTATTTQ